MPTLDLIVRNAALPDGRLGQDIGAADGRIVAIEPALDAEARTTLDAKGRLVSPPPGHQPGKKRSLQSQGHCARPGSIKLH